MTFTQTSQKFGQWSDVRANTVYGLGFASESELGKFIEKFNEVKEATKNAMQKGNIFISQIFFFAEIICVCSSSWKIQFTHSLSTLSDSQHEWQFSCHSNYFSQCFTCDIAIIDYTERELWLRYCGSAFVELGNRLSREFGIWLLCLINMFDVNIYHIYFHRNPRVRSIQ